MIPSLVEQVFAAERHRDNDRLEHERQLSAMRKSRTRDEQKAVLSRRRKESAKERIYLWLSKRPRRQFSPPEIIAGMGCLAASTVYHELRALLKERRVQSVKSGCEVRYWVA